MRKGCYVYMYLQLPLRLPVALQYSEKVRHEALTLAGANAQRTWKLHPASTSDTHIMAENPDEIGLAPELR